MYIYMYAVRVTVPSRCDFADRLGRRLTFPEFLYFCKDILTGVNARSLALWLCLSEWMQCDLGLLHQGWCIYTR